MIYFIAFSFSLLSSLLTDIAIKRKQFGRNHIFKTVACFLGVLLPLLLVSALRYDVGMDYSYTYMPMIESSLKGSIPDTEIFFQFILTIMYRFQLFPQFFFIVTSFIVLIPIVLAIFIRGRNITFSLLIFLFTSTYFWTLSNIRQACGFALALLGFALLWFGKSPKKFIGVIFILITPLFHLSCLIYWVFLFYYLFIHLKRKTFIFLFFLAVIISPILLQLLKFFVTSYTKYGYFFDMSGYEIETKQFVTIPYELIVTGFAIYKSKFNFNRILNIFLVFKLFVIYCLLLNLMTGNGELFIRTYRIVSGFDIVLIPYLCDLMQKNCEKLPQSAFDILRNFHVNFPFQSTTVALRQGSIRYNALIICIAGYLCLIFIAQSILNNTFDPLPYQFFF